MENVEKEIENVLKEYKIESVDVLTAKEKIKYLDEIIEIKTEEIKQKRQILNDLKKEKNGF